MIIVPVSFLALSDGKAQKKMAGYADCKRRVSPSVRHDTRTENQRTFSPSFLSLWLVISSGNPGNFDFKQGD